MRIYIVRHADPDYTNDTLTPAGHEQAQILAQDLQTLKIQAIYASPLGRTQMTARYTADLLDLRIQTEDWMRELEGVWIKDLNQSCAEIFPLGKSLEQSMSEARERGMRGIPEEFYQPDPCLMEENMNFIRQGSDAFMLRHGFLRQESIYPGTSFRVLQENREAIAVFTHMGVGLVWLAYLLDIPLPMMWSGFFLHPASITTVLMDERQPGYAVPRCIGLGDISHLCKAGSSPRPVGIFANAE